MDLPKWYLQYGKCCMIPEEGLNDISQASTVHDDASEPHVAVCADSARGA